MALIRVLIADDEPGMRLVLRKIIERVEGFAVCAEATNGREALELFERERPQVVFLDVEMGEVSGIDCARQIADTDPLVRILFATAHEKYWREAFEVYAFDYLIKPFKVERVMETLEKLKRLSGEHAIPAQQAPAQPPPAKGVKKLMLRHKDGISLVDTDAIVLIQREERSTVIVTADGKRIVTSDTLTELYDRLDKNVFLRSHKSYIINLTMVYEVYPYGRWTYIARLRNTDLDALITHEKFEEMETMLSGG